MSGVRTRKCQPRHSDTDVRLTSTGPDKDAPADEAKATEVHE